MNGALEEAYTKEEEMEGGNEGKGKVGHKELNEWETRGA